MFKGTSKSFKFYYFMSSFLITYCTMLLVLIMTNFHYYQANMQTFLKIFDDPHGYHLTLIVLAILVIIALFSLIMIKHKMVTSVLQYSKTLGDYKVTLGKTTDYGMQQVVVYEIVIPALFTLVLHSTPIFLLILLIFWQLFRYLAFSSDKRLSHIYQNSGLLLLGYRYYCLQNIAKQNNKYKFEYVLVNKHQLKHNKVYIDNAKSHNNYKFILVIPIDDNVGLLEKFI